jgi:hypothetical protein
MATARLTASDGALHDFFGISVAVSGNTIVVSAPYKDSSRGAVYVFVEPATGWATMTETAKLTASDSASGDYFGWSVALDGNFMAVGAPDATIGSNSAQGAAYVFVRQAGGWATTSRFKAKLTASDGTAGDSFASSISLAGNTLVAGAANATIGSNSSQGAAYVFVKGTGGWSTATQTAKLTASNGLAGDDLGWSVGTAGATVVAGAPYATVGSKSGQGAAYVFQIPITGWANMTETAIVAPSHATANKFFGGSVGASGNSVVISAALYRRTALYIFVKPSTGWTSTSTSVRRVAPAEQSGGLVAISGSTIVSSVPDDQTAFVFERQP